MMGKYAILAVAVIGLFGCARPDRDEVVELELRHYREFASADFKPPIADPLWYGHERRTAELLERFESGEYDADALALDAYAEIRLAGQLGTHYDHIGKSGSAGASGGAAGGAAATADLRTALLGLIFNLAMNERSETACEILLVQIQGKAFTEPYQHAVFAVMNAHPGLVSEAFAKSNFIRFLSEDGVFFIEEEVSVQSTTAEFGRSFAIRLLAKDPQIFEHLEPRSDLDYRAIALREMEATSHPVLKNRWSWLAWQLKERAPETTATDSVIEGGETGSGEGEDQ